MPVIKTPQLIRSLVWLAVLVAGFLIGPLYEQDYEPDDVIEYKVGGSVPVKWEQGVVIRKLDNGKQYLIHEKPSRFFPEGPEVAYSLDQLRRPQKGNDPAPDSTDKTKAPKTPPAPGIEKKPIAVGKGLLSEDDVLAYAKQLFGSGDPFAHPKREELLDQIREHIKSRGTNFLSSLDYDNKLHAIGASTVHITSAINANYGAAPKLEDYVDTFLLRSANRGTKSATQSGTKITITTTDAQYESGELTIHKNETYTWKVFRDDPPAKWITGKWREVKATEMNKWEAGPAIWLEKAKQGEDYMVRMCRVPGWLDWVDVGMGTGRTPVEYGRRP